MATFIYKARDASGKAVKGEMEAVSKQELIDKLHKMGYMVTKASEAAGGIKMESVFDKFKRITTEDMVMFNIQLSNMISAGINLLTSLSTLSEQIDNKRLSDVVGSVSRSVESGESFSQALTRHPRIFSKLFVNMVKAGEISGKLEIVLKRLAEFTERQAALAQMIRGALFYPAILLCAGVAVVLFVVSFVIPQFVEIYTKSGIALPLPTVILYKVGIGIKKYWYLMIMAVAFFAFAIRYYIRTERGALVFDRLKLRLPILGSLSRKAAISRFARTMGTLVASGVPILEALAITKEVVGNEVLARVVTTVRESVERGDKIAEPLKISGEFPPDAVQMISVGEDSGNLDNMLNKVADFYDMAVEYTVKKLTTILEPLFLLIMGAMVGFIMASMLLPMFDMVKVLKH